MKKVLGIGFIILLFATPCQAWEKFDGVITDTYYQIKTFNDQLNQAQDF